MSQVNIDEQVKQQTKILEDLSNIENSSVSTKKEYIIKLKEVTRPLILSGYYPDVELSDFCSFISGMLEKHNISYSRTSLPSLFDDDEKRVKHTPKNFLKEEVADSPPQKVEGLIGKLDFMEKQVGKHYNSINNYDPADKLYQLEMIAAKASSHIKTFTKKLFQANYFVDTFEKQFGTIEDAEKTAQDLPRKQRQRFETLIAIYHTSVLLISEMEADLADITEIKEIQAKQAMVSRDIDERSKISNWEKIMIWLAMKAEGIAKNRCAKLNGIDKKHITNNIYPEQCPVEPYGENKHHTYKSWFKCLLFKCRHCGKEDTVDISRKIDEQIERKKLDLDFKPFVVETASVV